MPGALKWLDIFVGVDFHAVMVPGQPAPVILPHLAAGIVFDPVGLMLSCALGAGPVLVNGQPAATAATAIRFLTPHRPTPPRRRIRAERRRPERGDRHLGAGSAPPRLTTAITRSGEWT